MIMWTTYPAEKLKSLQAVRSDRSVSVEIYESNRMLPINFEVQSAWADGEDCKQPAAHFPSGALEDDRCSGSVSAEFASHFIP
jgi:hypothetical protein